MSVCALCFTLLFCMTPMSDCGGEWMVNFLCHLIEYTCARLSAELVNRTKINEESMSRRECERRFAVSDVWTENALK